MSEDAAHGERDEPRQELAHEAAAALGLRLLGPGVHVGGAAAREVVVRAGERLGGDSGGGGTEAAEQRLTRRGRSSPGRSGRNWSTRRPPEPGELDISTVRDSTYFFS